MKSEERHELKENDLAGWIYSVPAFLNRYGSYLLFGLVLILLGYNVYRYIRNEQDRKIQTAWAELSSAAMAENPPVKLTSVISQYEVRPVQALAYLAIGDYYLEYLNLGRAPEGSSAAKLTPKAADAEAERAYNKVLSEYADQPLAVARAHLGLARLNEDRQDWPKAREQYGEFTKENGPFAGMPYFVAIAQDRLENLKEWEQPAQFGPPMLPPATAPATRPSEFPLPGGFLPSLLPGSGSGGMGPLPFSSGVLPMPMPATEPAGATAVPPATLPAMPGSH